MAISTCERFWIAQKKACCKVFNFRRRLKNLTSWFHICPTPAANAGSLFDGTPSHELLCDVGTSEIGLKNLDTWFHPGPSSGANAGLFSMGLLPCHTFVSMSSTKCCTLLAGRLKLGVLERADKDVSCHWLRHAHASHALDRGAPIHLVQATLGHADVATKGRYLHARPNDSSSKYLSIC